MLVSDSLKWHTSDVDLSFESGKTHTMAQVKKLSHTTCDTVVHRLGRGITLNNPARAQQDGSLNRLQRHVARIEKAGAPLRVPHTSGPRSDTRKEVVG
jgi:hypothetical protein